MEERIEEQAVAGGEEKTLEQLFSELEAVTGALEEESSLAAPRRQNYARNASWASRAKDALEILDRAGLF